MFDLLVVIDMSWLKVALFQTAFTCSNLTMETLEKGVNYVQSQQ